MKLNRENLGGAKKLKLICVTATGYDCIDTAYCREQGIGVCNVPGYSTESVAQITLTMALSLAASSPWSTVSIANSRLESIYQALRPNLSPRPVL